MRHCDRVTRWLPVLLVAGLLSGCAGTVPGTPRPTSADLGGLDVGEWNTSPLPVPAQGTRSYGHILESARLAEAVIHPIDLDATLVNSVTALIPTPLASVGVLADVARPILTEYGMVAGYSMTASDHDGERTTLASRSTLTRVTVISFPDAHAADSAAREIGAADFAAASGNVAVAVPGHDGAHGHWLPGVPTVGVYVAHGSFLVVLYIRLPEADRTALAAVAAVTLDAQLPRLDTFAPTPADQLDDLPLDPDAMLRRMVPMRPGQWIYPSLTRRENYFREVTVAIGLRMNGGVVLGPGGVDHETRIEQTDTGTAGELGIERLAVNGLESLYRFRDASSARRYFDGVVRSVSDSGGGDRTIIAGPAGVPDTLCYRIEFHGTDPYNRCYLLDGGYLATVIGPGETFVRRRAAAQYALLANSR
ncbi:hypothetical protein [Nocardia sp. NPDC050406]|uniref:DUF7373 family lipoprotein n=1 Tax=Nocardia sp. NPDC050406 TaxID=3364318 RepID=UPI00379777E3